MIEISDKLREIIESRSIEIIPVVEIYPRTTVDISSIGAPANAIGRFSDRCYTWENSCGSFEYKAKVLEYPSVELSFGNKENEAEIVLSNVERGVDSASRFILDNKLKGTWTVIRLIFPDLPEESWVIWWGKSLKPGAVSSTEVNISATQEIGNYRTKLPFRSYSSIKCPLTPGKGDCLGDETLEEKSALYRQQFALYGTMLCPDRIYETCYRLGNTEYFQGQRNVAIKGTFSYVDTSSEDDQKKNKKSELPTIKTESWSSFNQSDSNEIVPLAFGRSQIAGYPFTWADTGEQVRSLQGFCEGRISDFDFIRSRNINLAIVGQPTEHYGDYGGVGSNSTPDQLFNGLSGFNSRLAYLEVVTSGSKPEEVDNAPLITAVIRGMQVPTPDSNGDYTKLITSSNPVDITRFLLTDYKYGKIPTYRIEDSVSSDTRDYCDELLEDRSQCEKIVLPTNEFNNYDLGYRRYRSTSVYTAYTDMFENGSLPFGSEHPDLEQPLIYWYNPNIAPPVIPNQNVLRRRYAINGALQEETSLRDFLEKRIFPCYRGWLNYNRNGRIEIRSKRPADNAYLRASTPANEDLLSINNISPWRGNTDGYLLIGTSLPTSEIRKVKEILYSPACNNLPITAESTGGINVEVTPIGGGSKNNPGLGSITLSGTVSVNDTVELIFEEGENQYTISYTADGVEDLSCVARMLTGYLNANSDFNNYLTAYILPDNGSKIFIRCEAGFLKLDKPLEFDHDIFEEVLRVQSVYENCNELDSDTSSTFDNIIVNTLRWNTADQDDAVNGIVGIYTSAVDDFAIAKLIPRTNWDTIDAEGELNFEDLDLKFVDNYNQAARLAKARAIEIIDSNIIFEWSTGLSGFMLELGDVIAMRHDSGDGSIRYVPLFIEQLNYDISTFTTSITARLYLSAEFDNNIAPIEPFLTTTLNQESGGIQSIPEPIGSVGGVFGGSGGTAEIEGRSRIYPRYTELYNTGTTYSPDGIDRV